MYNYPDFYDKSPIPSFASKYPNLISAIKGKHVTEEKLFHESKLTTLNGVAFHSFAKSTYFNNGKLTLSAFVYTRTCHCFNLHLSGFITITCTWADTENIL